VTEIEIRSLQESEVPAAVDLVMAVFTRFVAADCRPEGIASFVGWANAQSMSQRLGDASVVWIAAHDGRILGVLEFIPPDHLAMLFVDPAVQGRGIGRRLFEAAMAQVLSEHPRPKEVRVNASRYALQFYRHLGFRDAGPEMERNGLRFTPMTFVP
jgi:GNAT superfamily N-acetyltransferase